MEEEHLEARMSRAIAYFANGIGNFVLSMPALQALRDLSGSPADLCLPDIWTDYRRRAVIEIANAWDVIGKIIEWPEQNFNPDDYEYWFYSPHNSGSDLSILFTERRRGMAVPRPAWRESMIHEEDHYMDIVYALGYEGSRPEASFPLSSLPILDLSHPIIGICNGAFGTPEWVKKRWPHFARLSEVLMQYLNASVVAVGGDNEMQDIPCTRNYAGELSILETAKVISQCDLFISTDTGNMHIADRLSIPVLTLFGSTLPSKNAPRGREAKIVSPDMECSPCQDSGRFHRCKDNECMKNISVGDVMATARKILKEV
jgi:hypothetical protein